MDNLTAEIAKRILLDVGITPVEADYGKHGLTEKMFRTKKDIKIKYDNEVLSHPMFSGQMVIGNSTLRALFIDLSVDKYFEFLLTFRMDAMSIFTVKWVVEEDSETGIRVWNEKTEAWTDPGMIMKANMLANFEKIVSWGILWQPCENTDDLYDSAIKLIG